MFNGKSAEPIEAGAARAREVVGTVRRIEAVEQIGSELLAAGFDRSDIDLMGEHKEVLRSLHATYLDPAGIAEVPELPRRELVMRSDDALLSILLFGMLSATGALIALLLSFGSEAGTAGILLRSVIGATFGVLIAFAVRKRVSRFSALQKDLQLHSIAVFVRVRDANEENVAKEILMRCGASNVHVHEVLLRRRIPSPFCAALKT